MGQVLQLVPSAHMLFVTAVISKGVGSDLYLTPTIPPACTASNHTHLCQAKLFKCSHTYPVELWGTLPVSQQSEEHEELKFLTATSASKEQLQEPLEYLCQACTLCPQGSCPVEYCGCLWPILPFPGRPSCCPPRALPDSAPGGLWLS